MRKATAVKVTNTLRFEKYKQVLLLHRVSQLPRAGYPTIVNLGDEVTVPLHSFPKRNEVKLVWHV